MFAKALFLVKRKFHDFTSFFITFFTNESIDFDDQALRNEVFVMRVINIIL